MRGALLFLPLLLAACGKLSAPPPGPPQNLTQVWGLLLEDPLTRPGSFTPANFNTGGVVPDEAGNLYILTRSVPYNWREERDDVVLMKVSPDGTYRGVVVTDEPLRRWILEQGFQDCDLDVYENNSLAYQGGLLYATFSPRREANMCYTLFGGNGAVIVAYEAQSLTRVGYWVLIPGQGALAGVRKLHAPFIAPHPEGGVLGLIPLQKEGEDGGSFYVLRLPRNGPPEVRPPEGEASGFVGGFVGVQGGEGYVTAHNGALHRFGWDLGDVRWRLDLQTGPGPFPPVLTGALDLEGDTLVWGDTIVPILGQPFPDARQYSVFLLRLDPTGRPRWVQYLDQFFPGMYIVRHLGDRGEILYASGDMFFLDPATGEVRRRLMVWESDPRGVERQVQNYLAVVPTEDGLFGVARARPVIEGNLTYRYAATRWRWVP